MNYLKILLLVLVVQSFSAQAEYNGHHIEFNISMKDGSEIHGYNFISMVYRKDQATSYKEFLEENYHQVLRNDYDDGFGDFKYYQNRIKYAFNNYGDTESYIYTVLNAKSIDTSEIKSFDITELIDQSYAIGISSFHKLSDSTWMNITPVGTHSFGGYFCSNNIYIHEKSTKTDRVIIELQLESERITNETLSLEKVQGGLNGEEYYKIEESLETIKEESDERINKIINGLDGEKVVIITMCTC